MEIRKRKRLIRLAEVLDRVPFGRSTLYLKVEAGEFPARENLNAPERMGRRRSRSLDPEPPRAALG